MRVASYSIYETLSHLLGANPTPEKAGLIGQIHDCNGDYLQGMQVILKTETGDIPAGMLSGYF